MGRVYLRMVVMLGSPSGLKFIFSYLLLSSKGSYSTSSPSSSPSVAPGGAGGTKSTLGGGEGGTFLRIKGASGEEADWGFLGMDSVRVGTRS